MVATTTNQRLSAPLHVEIKFGGFDSVFTDRSKPSSYASRNFQIGLRLNAPRPRRNSRQLFSITESKSTNPKARRVGPCCLRVRSEVRLLLYYVPSKFNLLYTAICAREHTSKLLRHSKTFAWPTPEMYASTTTLSPYASALLRLHRTDSTLTSSCIATTRHPAARALRQPCRAPRVLVYRPQRLYIGYTVHRRDIVFWAYDYFDYSSRLVSPRKLVENGFRDINN
jgi:hypothetical protein